MTTPSITLHTATPADFHEIALLELEVFSDDFCNLAFGPQRSSPKNILHREKILGSQPSEKGGRNVVTKAVVVNEEGREKIIGAAAWSFYTGREGVVEGEEEEKGGGEGKGVVQEELKKEGGWGEGANVRLCEDAFVWADEQVKKVTEGRNYASLNTIVISPRQQRKGIGKMLMEDGLKEVDRLGLQVAHGASEQGLGLYKKYGYVEIESKNINLSEYDGGEGMGSDSHTIVYRPAQKQA